MIVGTAGHIGAGKTSLLRALTGEGASSTGAPFGPPVMAGPGMALEFGYLHGQDACSKPDDTIAFVDVPGHAQMLHTMLAGATGIDLPWLVVAADDGVMPQTREHVAVLSLLGHDDALVTLSKIDRVDGARLRAVCHDVALLLKPTPMHGAPVLPVSAFTGEGLEACRESLRAWAVRHRARRDDEHGFRMAIDQVLTLSGAGTVVTGSVQSGHLQVGDVVALSPAATPRELRVHSLRAQGVPMDHVGPGQRCAIELEGVPRDGVMRGGWLVTPSLALPTDRLDVELRLWHDATQPLRHGASVQVHHGTRVVMGTLALLQPLGGPATAACPPDHPVTASAAEREGTPAPGTLAPGQRAIVQLLLSEPINAWHGDRVVLRGSSSAHVLAGGRVLDPQAPARNRSTPERLATLQVLRRADPVARLAGLIALAPAGFDLNAWRRREGRLATPDLPASALCVRTDEHELVLDATAAERLRQQAMQLLAAFHEEHSEELGPDIARWRRLVAPQLPDPLWRAALDVWERDGLVARRLDFVFLPAHHVRLSGVEQRIAQKVRAPLEAAGFEGAWARDLARAAQESEPLLRTTLARLAQRGELHQVVRDLYYPASTIERLAAIAREAAAEGLGEVRAAAFRDRCGLGRKRSIQVLEYFDRVGLLRRVGDIHQLRTDTEMFRVAMR